MKNRSARALMIGLLLIPPLVLVPDAQAADAIGTARMTVVAAMAITKTQDLQFGAAPQGAASAGVAPTAASPGVASFAVTGQPGRSFQITLPSDSEVVMTRSGGSGSGIPVTQFTSEPAGLGALSSTGTAEILVGAKRAPIPADQAPGAYSGQFTVQVVY